MLQFNKTILKEIRQIRPFSDWNENTTPFRTVKKSVEIGIHQVSYYSGM